jgi:hypothetical protein
MDTKEAVALGNQIAAWTMTGGGASAYALLQPVLSARTPFRLLDRIGAQVGCVPLPMADGLLHEIAHGNTLGGWPLIGAILAGQLTADLPAALERCRRFIIAAGVWHATDSFGERVLGPALLMDFRRTLTLLAAWRTDSNRWVRRSTGVGIHFWAKRTHGGPDFRPQARRLLAFLRPMFTEQEMDAAKGVGWALKTMGRYYSDITAEWVVRQVANPGHYRALLLRKATRFLAAKDRNRIRRAAAK